MRSISLAVLAVLALAASAHAAEVPADLVLRNGYILTQDAAHPHAHSVATRGGFIIALDDVDKLIGPQTRVVDLEKQVKSLSDANAAQLASMQNLASLDQGDYRVGDQVLGAEIIFFDRATESREEIAARIASETGATTSIRRRACGAGAPETSWTGSSLRTIVCPATSKLCFTGSSGTFSGRPIHAGFAT